MAVLPDYRVIPELPASVYVAPLHRPAGLREDWLEPVQRQYSQDEHRIWDDLYERQMKLIPGRACKEFMFGLDVSTCIGGESRTSMKSARSCAV